MNILVRVDRCKRNGAHAATAVVTLHNGEDVQVRAEGRTEIAARERAASAALAVVLGELARGRLAWVEYRAIEFDVEAVP